MLNQGPVGVAAPAPVAVHAAAAPAPGAAVAVLEDIRAAMDVVRASLPATPLMHHPLLDARVGCQTWVKLENAQDVGSFKLRGAINLLVRMPAEERSRGLVTATRGNHGHAVAYAARMHGVCCTVFVPRGNSPEKNGAMTALGAQVIETGHDFDAAMIAAEEHAARTGARLVHTARDPDMIAGAGTIALEMLEQADQPFDAVFIPVGAGGVAAAMATVIKAHSPATRVIGVCAENAPAMHHAWHTGENHPFAAVDTLADGLAVRVPVQATLAVMRRQLDDVLLVSEREIQQAIVAYAATVHQMAEGAAAAALAGAMRYCSEQPCERIGVVLTGGNIDAATLMRALADERPFHQPKAMPYFPIGELSYGY
jgi:threonine dehydratase